MKKSCGIERYFYIIAMLVTTTGYATLHAQGITSPLFPDTTISQSPQMDESHLRYSNAVLNQDFDFQLKALSHGKFELNVLQDTKAMVSIKVYDVIGNLLYEENVKIRGSFAKEYDLSELKTRFFIVEIGNESFNKTKSIVAT